MHFYLGTALIVSGVVGVTGVKATGLSVPIELDGYAWSATTGWISMNCDQSSAINPTNTCVGSAGPGPKVDYGVHIETDGRMTGYAWSSSVGWIRFGGLSGFPAGAGVSAQNATAIGTYGDTITLTGWARACSGAASPTSCSGGVNANSGGWDGWIALAGNAAGGYGITFTGNNADNGASKYAWGGPYTMGWIDFSPTQGNGVTLRPQLDIVINGMSSTPGLVDTDGFYTSMTFLADVAGIPNGEAVAYTLRLGSISQTGTVTGTIAGPIFSPALSLNNVPFNTTDSLVLEVDMPAPGDVLEINESNIYTTGITLAIPAPTMVISGPDAVRSGEAAEVSWTVSAPYPVTCTARGPGINQTVAVVGALGAADAVTGNQQSSTLTSATTFELTCVVGSTTYTETHQVEVIPTFQEI